jgi:hypothetical protein
MSTLAALVLVKALLGAPHAVVAPPERLFAAAHAVPDDVRFYVHIEDVQALRENLERLPIADWAGQFLGGGQFIMAWGQLAQLAGVNNAGLIDLVVGDSITLMVRGSGAEMQWLLLTPMDDDRARRLYSQLKVTVKQSEKGYSLCILPEHRLMLARTTDGTMLVSPQNSPKLMYSVLGLMGFGAAESRKPGLDRQPAMRTARLLGQGQAGVYIAHDPPLGGWSVATLDFQGERVSIRHRARFDQDAFMRPAPEREIDPSIVANFRDDALLAVLEPTEIGGNSIEFFVQQWLGGQPLLSREIRENLADVRLFVVGDMEGRMQDHQADMLLPTGALCFKVKNGDIAEKQLDEHMIALSAALRRLGERLGKRMGDWAFVINVPNRREFIPGESRQVSLDSFTDWIGNGLPLLKNVDLCWQCLETPNGAFLVIATHEQALETTRRALEKEIGPALPAGAWANCGIANGVRIGQNLDSLIDQVVVLAEPGRERELKASLQLLSSFAFGIKHVSWRMARPCGNEMRLDVELELAPPVSADNE